MSALNRRSAMVLALLFGLVFAVGLGLVWYFSLAIYDAIIFAVVVVVLQFVLSPIIIDHIFSISWSDPHQISLDFAVWFEQVCASRGIRRPRLGLIRDGNPNAFTYGRFQSDARLIVTTGLVDVLSPEELQAVVAHELGHIIHHDFVVMTAAQIVPMILYIVYVWTSDRIKGSYAFVISVGAYLTYLFSQYVVLMLSRVREFFADEESAAITANPNALSSALIKISYGMAKRTDKAAEERWQQTGQIGTRPARTASTSATAALAIANIDRASSFAMTACDSTGAFSYTAMLNAMRWDLLNPWARWYQFFSTHPRTGSRILKLNQISQKSGVPPAFDLENDGKNVVIEQRYTGNFVLEFILYALPVIGGLTSLAIGFRNNDLHTKYSDVAYFLIGYGLLKFIKTALTYPRAQGTHREISELVANEINVSQVMAVPCCLGGTIVGRGVPGLFWSKDLVLRDNSGIITLLYRQPFFIFEWAFALLKADRFIGRNVRVHGWYRRSHHPYIEVSHLETVDGSSEKVRCYFVWGIYALSLIFVVGGWLWIR